MERRRNELNRLRRSRDRRREQPRLPRPLRHRRRRGRPGHAVAVTASILDPPLLPDAPRPRQDLDDEWDDSVTSPWDQS
ncbi:hypothetical protein [Lentzea sp. E54]|uniref:hypothetical protein n=1 Tax=Lentzea xerophila TaxID=3435883 RepID=UPI003DA49158